MAEDQTTRVASILGGELMAHRLRISGHCHCGQYIGHEPWQYARHVARAQVDALCDEGLLQ